LNEWINHKIAVREHSQNINVRIDNLRIFGSNDQATALFTQHYSSNLLKNKGNKKLDLRKTNGRWEIYKESMQ